MELRDQSSAEEVRQDVTLTESAADTPIENTEIIGRPKHAESRPNIGNTADCGRKACFQIKKRSCQKERSQRNADHIKSKIDEYAFYGCIIKGIAVNFDAFNGTGVAEAIEFVFDKFKNNHHPHKLHAAGGGCGAASANNGDKNNKVCEKRPLYIISSHKTA